MIQRFLSALFPRPELTVALPMYRSRRIAWLALESLARQEDVNFPWELVIAEERGEALRERGIRAYEPALRRVGCVRVRYIGLKNWLPLAMKWRLIARHASPRSSVFLLQAADCYSPPRRLRETFDLMADPGVDWCQTTQGAAYHLRLRRTLRFDAEMENASLPTGYFLAMRTEHARRLPESARERQVDLWLYETAAAIKGAPLRVGIGGEWWHGGLETKGLNCISTLDWFFQHPSAPFRPDKENLLAALPPDIQQRLHALGNEPIPLDAERRRRLRRNLRRHLGGNPPGAPVV